MAEALAAVGLRLAREAYSFVWAIKDAPRDTQDFAALIDDIRRAMEIVRAYIAQHATMPAAHPDLPASLTDGVRNLVERTRSHANQGPGVKQPS